jgi:hypothetical protein
MDVVDDVDPSVLIEKLVAEFDAEGQLDHDHVREAMFSIHSMARQLGLNPESIDTYKAVIFALNIVASAPPGCAEYAMDAAALACARAIRDLNARGC